MKIETANTPRRTQYLLDKYSNIGWKVRDMSIRMGPLGIQYNIDFEESKDNNYHYYGLVNCRTKASDQKLIRKYIFDGYEKWLHLVIDEPKDAPEIHVYVLHKQMPKNKVWKICKSSLEK